MRIIHFSDLHYADGRKGDLALQSLETVLLKGLSDGVGTYLFTGDLFDGPVQNGAGLDKLAGLLSEAPGRIYYVRGTKSHDAADAYDIIRRVATNMVEVTSLSHFDHIDNAGERLIIMGCPEPSLAMTANDVTVMRSEMSKIFLGQGLIRQENPEVPCVYLFHGHVEGAEMDNHQQVDRFIVGKEDLLQVGADYYALGHIHLGQNILDDKCPMMYAGSAYPVNWGETDQKTFVEVTITGRENVGIQRQVYPHKPRVKVVVVGVELIPEPDSRVDSWLEISSENGVDHAPIPDGYARVTYKTLRRETIRMPEISEKTSVLDKVRAWLTHSSLKEPGNLTEAYEEMEIGEHLAEATQRHSFRIVSLKLGNAIGIKDGIGKDEVSLNLEAIPPGVVALYGPTGSGKTTLLENLTPYDTMLTRRGSLSHHFREGGLRELIIEDRVDGSFYMVNLRTGSNTLRRALYKMNGRNEWAVVAEGHPAFGKAVDDLFGSMELYSRLVFSPQSNRRSASFTDAADTERKDLIQQLVGLDHWEKHEDGAKTYFSVYQDGFEALDQHRKVLQQQVERDIELAGRALDAQQKVSQMERREAETEADLVEAKSVRDTLAFQGQEQQKLVVRLEEKKKAAETKWAVIDGLVNSKDKAEKAWEMLESAETTLANRRAVESELAELTDDERERDKAAQERALAYSQELNLHLEAKGVLMKVLGNLEKERGVVEASQSNLKSEVKGLREVIDAQIGKCHVCGQPLIGEHAVAAVERKERAATDLTKKWEVLQAITNLTLPKIDDELEVVSEQLRGLEAPMVPPVHERDVKPRLAELAAKLEAITPEAQLLDIIPRGKRSGEDLVRINADYSAATTAHDASCKEIEESMKSIDDTLYNRLDIAERAFGQSQEQHKQAGIDYGVATQVLQALTNEKEAAKARLEALTKLDADLEISTSKMETFDMLKTAFGRKGIPALEIDALGPMISKVANEILGEVYEDRFSVTFETQRQSADGKFMIEDYNVLIDDRRTGRTKRLDDLSGGEEYLILRAIYDAFAYVRKAQTGTEFLDGFLDEGDGRLHPEMREDYLRILEKSRKLLGRDHTLVITHSKELQERAEQSIRMEEL